MNKSLLNFNSNTSIKVLLLSVLLLAGRTYAQNANAHHDHNHDEESGYTEKEGEEHSGHNHENFDKTFVAVHGAVLFQSLSFTEKEERFENINGSPKKWNATASVPMFAIAMGYKFSPKTDFIAKVEFEYGGFGGHQHLHHHGEDAHVGLEKSGAVTVERVFLTHRFSEHFKFRVGHMPMPMGQVYLAHEPTAYMSSIGAKADSKVIPREWQETGFSILGNINHHLKYQLMCVSGFDADYFEPINFISEGKQSKFEKIYFSSPALLGRLDYQINHLKLGMVGYWGNTDLNAQDQHHAGRNINVSLLEADVRYRTNQWHLLSNIIYGNVTNPEKLDEAIAKNAISGSMELGYNINHKANIIKHKKNALWLFGRVDYGNPMLKMPNGFQSDIRSQELSVTGGINLFVNHAVAVKADYEYIFVGDDTINNEQIISLSVAFSFMPYKK